MAMHNSNEYINDFLYFVLAPYESGAEPALLYCSGVNIDGFLPVTKGRHRPMSNPAVRGLQLVRHGVSSLALSKGATPRACAKNDCARYVPPKDTWYTEGLLIENAPGELPYEVINYAVVELLRKINRAIMLGADMPDELPGPKQLQAFLEGLCRRYGT